jgi:hypothetical protein
MAGRPSRWALLLVVASAAVLSLPIVAVPVADAAVAGTHDPILGTKPFGPHSVTTPVPAQLHLSSGGNIDFDGAELGAPRTADAPVAPVNTALPVVSGATTGGSVLSCSTGAWTGSPTGYAYAWLRDGAPVEAEETRDYIVRLADFTHVLACRVTASNPGGAASAYAVGVTVPVPLPGAPETTGLPVVSGATSSGSVLSCSTGVWTGAPTGYAFAWLRDGALITAQTASHYTVVAADVGHQVACRVTASYPDGSAIAFAVGVSVPVPLPGAPVNTGLPVVSGATTSGSVLSCSTGAWTASPTGYAYAWLLDGSDVAGQTAGAYTILETDVGHELSCRVTAANPGGSASAFAVGVSVSAPVTVPVECVVPSLQGVTLASARRRLVHAHCAVGRVTRVHSRSVRRGRVIRASVATNTHHRHGFKVSLRVSLGA